MHLAHLRALDVLLAISGSLLLAPLILLLWAVGWAETGSPLFQQVRIGRHQKPFTLVKFRTMRCDTPSVATHLADQTAVTSVGRFLRRTKLDELPQLWNVLKGDMSLVGPRPCLPEQRALIDARQALGVHEYRPGITGASQLAGIDMSDPERLAVSDAKMLSSLSLRNYFLYIVWTVTGGGRGDRLRSGDRE